ncbi:MAG: glycoside hydrolase family 2 protein [Spirochaetaceae bacterium]|nr:glycoside hydrolase family 2 protein [Spirochaetaceae bacterium]
MRQKIALNNDWYYLPQAPEGFQGKDFDQSDYQPVRLPHSNVELPYNHFNEKDSQFISSYRRSLFIPQTAQGRVINLHFEGVMTQADLYINEKLVGQHMGGYTAFFFDISDYLHYGEENQLALKVDSRELSDIPPFGGVVDYLPYGGIYREVYLEMVAPQHMVDPFVKGRLRETPELELELNFVLPLQAEQTVEIKVVKVWPEEEDTPLYQEIHGLPKGEKSWKFCQAIPQAQPWDIDNPQLYEMEATLQGVDRISRRFGFREVKFTDQGFFLNGNPLKLRGLNHHQSYPFVGYAMPQSAQYSDVEILKNELGVNTVRLSHYPHSRHFLDRCDELGLLVFNEIPGWQYLGGPLWKEVAKINLQEMILQDRHHPCIFIWGVRINESADCDELYRETNRIARQLDDSRPTGGVRNFKKSHFFEDVYTYNDFIHSGEKIALEPPRSVTGSNKGPYLVSEHNGHMFPTKKTDSQNRRLEQALRHGRVLNAMYGNPRISGAIGWCMFDYNTHKDFGSGDRICHHGVMDMFRLPKYAAWLYASQQESTPFGRVAHSMNIGDADASLLGGVWIFSNSDFVRVYKNDICLGDYYPNIRDLPHLPHPPILIDDFIGNQIEQNEPYGKANNRRLKRALLDISRMGKMGFKSALGIFWVVLTTPLTRKMGYQLYTKYLNSWGSDSLTYRFEGYQGSTKVWEQKLGAMESRRFNLRADYTTLKETATWQTTRVVVEALDQFGNVLHYAGDPLQIQVDGSLELIGPDLRNLYGGSTAFWVKTTGETGEARISVSSPGWDEVLLSIMVE